MNNKKYMIIDNKDMAICLKMLSQQNPYVYPHNFDKERFVWSFINDEAFQEALMIARELITKNKNIK